MVDVELVSFKIAKLKMNNDITEDGMLQVENSVESNVKYEDDNKMAVMVLNVKVEHRRHPDVFGIELKLQGTFRVDSVNDIVSKREAHVKCYDVLFPYVEQIMTYLAINSGLHGFALEKSSMSPEKVNYGSEAKDGTCGKIIEIRLDV